MSVGNAKVGIHDPETNEDVIIEDGALHVRVANPTDVTGLATEATLQSARTDIQQTNTFLNESNSHLGAIESAANVVANKDIASDATASSIYNLLPEIVKEEYKYQMYAGPITEDGFLYICKMIRGGSYFIKRKVLATGLWEYYEDGSDVIGGWAARATHTYHQWGSN